MPPLDFPPRLEEELFPPRKLLLFAPLRAAPLLDARLELFEPPRERPPLDLIPRELLDFFEPEDLEPERLLLLLLDDFFALADFLLPEDLPPPDDDFRPLEDFFELDDFEPLPRFADEDRLPLDDLPPELLLLLEDFPDPRPVARFAAPAAWVTARFALSTF